MQITCCYVFIIQQLFLRNQTQTELYGDYVIKNYGSVIFAFSLTRAKLHGSCSRFQKHRECATMMMRKKYPFMKDNKFSSLLLGFPPLSL